MKLLILTGNKNFHSSNRFIEEAEKLQIDLTIAEYSQILISDQSTSSIRDKTGKFVERISDFTHLIFRGYGKYQHIRAAILNENDILDKQILNKNSYYQFPGTHNKLMQFVILKRNNVPIIPFFQTGDEKAFDRLLD